MGNTAHLKFPKRITLPQFHGYLQQALAATFGDALVLDGAITDKGSCLRNPAGPQGVGLVQFWYESRGHISVDHRRGAVGYMVTDAMLAWLARHLNGRVFETGTGEYMDLTREHSVYFMDTVRRAHAILSAEDAKNPDPNRVPETLEDLVQAHRAHEKLHFRGKFARFWDREGIPIEEEVV